MDNHSQRHGVPYSACDPTSHCWRHLSAAALTLHHQLPQPQAYYNALEGDLPDKLPPNLIQLALTGNSFTGSVPALPRGMKYFSLAENDLQGPLPNGPGAGQLWFVSTGHLVSFFVRVLHAMGPSIAACTGVLSVSSVTGRLQVHGM